MFSTLKKYDIEISVIKDLCIIHSHYHSVGWCLGKWRSKAFRNCDTGLFLQNTTFCEPQGKKTHVHVEWLYAYLNDWKYSWIISLKWRTVYPKKYAHGFCFAVLCCGYTLTDFPYPSGLLHWHCGNLTTAPVPAKQPWWIWINTSCEFIMNDYITTTKQSTTKPCAYFLGYTVMMRAMASQITSLTIVEPTVYSRHRSRKTQSSASLVFEREIHWWPVNFRHKGPVTRMMFPFYDAIMWKEINKIGALSRYIIPNACLAGVSDPCGTRELWRN